VISKTKARQKPGFELQINLHLFKAVVNPAFGQVIWGHLNLNFVASQNTDAVFAHLTCRMCDDLMAVFQLDPKRRIAEVPSRHREIRAYLPWPWSLLCVTLATYCELCA